MEETGQPDMASEMDQKAKGIMAGEVEQPTQVTTATEMGTLDKAKAMMQFKIKTIILPDALFVVQFLLGMYINLYVNFPKTSYLDDWRFAFHSIPVILHILNGTLILVMTVITLIRMIRMKNRHMIVTVSIGTFAMLMAVISGERFISTQNDIASFFMSLGFLIGILTFNIGVLTM